MRFVSFIVLALLALLVKPSPSEANSCEVSLGAASFRDGGTVDVLASTGAFSSTFRWRVLSPQGGGTFTAEDLGDVSLADSRGGYTIFSNPILRQIVGFRRGELMSVTPSALQSPPSNRDDDVITGDVAFDETGRAKIVYIARRPQADGDRFDLVVVEDSEPAAGNYAEIHRIVDVPCGEGRSRQSDSEIATELKVAAISGENDELFFSCAGPTRFEIYAADAGTEPTSLVSSNLRVVAIEATRGGLEGDDPSFFVVIADDDTNDRVALLTEQNAWQLASVGELEGQGTTIHADGTTWVAGVWRQRSTIGRLVGEEWQLSSGPSGDEPVVGLTSDPLGILVERFESVVSWQENAGGAWIVVPVSPSSFQWCPETSNGCGVGGLGREGGWLALGLLVLVLVIGRRRNATLQMEDGTPKVSKVRKG